jgi:hypothetical protein
MVYDRPGSTGGATMKLAIVVFLLAVLTVAATTVGFAVWDGRIGHHRDLMRPIHYDNQYEPGSRHALPPG